MRKQRKPSLSQLLRQYNQICRLKQKIWAEERKLENMAALVDGCSGVVQDQNSVYRITASKSRFRGRLYVEKLGDVNELKEVIE